jgi:superfamily II DNA or RNA helicase
MYLGFTQKKSKKNRTKKGYRGGVKEQRCPNGTRRNKKTGICEPISPEPTATSPIPDAVITDTITNPGQVMEEEKVADVTSQIPTFEPQPEFGEPAQEDTHAHPPITKTIKKPNNKTVKKLKIIEQPEAPSSVKKIEFIDEPTPTIEPVEITDLLTKGESPIVDIDTGASHFNKKSNTYLLKKEKMEYDYNATNNDYDFLYPELNDPNFNIKIAKRKEFNDTKYDGTIYDIKKQADILCNAKFELMPHQIFVKNFLSFQTPYNSLLLYNALGSGKTCSAIGIAEEYRSYMKQVGINQRIIVVASPNVQTNFRLQLFDERKLELIRNSAVDTGLWNIESCVGNALIQEINPTQLKGLTKEKVISQIKRIIDTYYLFMGYGQLANFISNSLKEEVDIELSQEEIRKIEIRKIKKIFNNRLIIIDEVHNSSEDKQVGVSLMKVAKYAENMRFLLLSATPMFNSFKEIIWLVNLMNLNDKRAMIEYSDVFDKEGNFLPETTSPEGKVGEGGRELLVRKLTGYVSYVRGETPYTFPFRVYPTDFAKDHSLFETTYPKKQMNDAEIKEPMKYINIFTNNIGEYQEKGYNFMLKYMKQKSFDIYTKQGRLIEMPTFDNMESFGYTLLQAPLEALNIVYPNQLIDSLKEANELELFENGKDIIMNMIGKTGLAQIMNSVEETQNFHRIRYNFEYKPAVLKKYGPIFHKDNIHLYSAKISQICERIRNSKGIVIVYSQYIDGGVVPIALALEEMGFSRFSSAQNTKNLFKSSRTEQIDAITMKSRSEFSGNKEDFHPAKYVMITGDKAFSSTNAADIKYITNPNNSNGEQVKVVLISKAGAEGLDFKCIRQIHILEPWYNMNRIEQIIGRGVRNLSHCNLPFEERNVEIYLHTTLLDNGEESADLYIYRFAEKKAIQIGRITRLLKEVSVDCILNIGQNNFTVEKIAELAANQNIQINLSSKKTIDFKIGDKPFTDVCDYMENCSYTCSPNLMVTEEDIVKHTYNDSFVESNRSRIIARILQLFREHNVYTRKQLIDSINIVKQYPIEQIFSTFTYLIENKNEYLIDKYGRLGNLTNKDLYYIFQPVEITDENASLYERSVPIDYKRKSIFLEYSNEQQLPEEKGPVEVETEEEESGEKAKGEKVNGEKANGEKAKGDKVKGEKVKGENVKGKEKTDKTEKSFDTLIKEIEELLFDVFNTKKLVKGEKNWYRHAGLIVNVLKSKYGFDDNSVRKYMLDHILDMLLFADKMILINHLYGDNVPTNMTPVQELIKSYLDKRRVQSSGLVGFVIMKDDILRIYVENEETGQFVEADREDYELFVRDIDRFDVPKNSIHPLVGFVNLFTSKKSNQKEMVFKVKDLNQKRNNTGARIDDAGKEKIVKFLNIILGETIYNDENTENITQLGLCAILEMLMRQKTENSILGLVGMNTVYFLTPEQTAITEIVKYSK